jgi:hypothetical protein
MANEEDVVISLMASPMGKLLYSHLNFRNLGKIVVQVPGETAKVFLVPMVFDRKELATETQNAVDEQKVINGG